jgi:hypothetical protein
MGGSAKRSQLGAASLAAENTSEIREHVAEIFKLGNPQTRWITQEQKNTACI